MLESLSPFSSLNPGGGGGCLEGLESWLLLSIVAPNVSLKKGQSII
jgi:hypothetical protein